MFTGIIQSVGQLSDRREVGGELSIIIDTGTLDMSDVKLGDSIAVNGVCLTVTAFTDQSMQADISAETISKTTANDWTVGSELNLEKSLAMGDRLGGHLVSGHVDTCITCLSRESTGRSVKFTFELPQNLSKYVAVKGSVTLNGTSLTVNSVESDCFSVNLIDHTLEHTNLHAVEPGSRINFEVDMIARYLERMT